MNKSLSIVPVGRSQSDVIEAAAEADVFLLCDISSSMGAPDAGESGKEARYEVMTHVVRRLMGHLLNHTVSIAVIAFNDESTLILGEMEKPGGLTNMAEALRYVTTIANATGKDPRKAVMVSDGQPTAGGANPRESALKEAEKLPCPLDVMYVGPAGGEGGTFLLRLAAAGRGEHRLLSWREPEKLLEGLKVALLPSGTS